MLDVIYAPGFGFWLEVKVKHIYYFIVCISLILQRQALRSIVFQTDVLVIAVLRISK
jgi:hypothetical protein